MKPAIVIVTYNRPTSLIRLLESLDQSDYGEYNDIPCIICIDGEGDAETITLAEHYDWKYGTKRIIKQPYNIGLRKHIIKCGDLVSEYGSIIIFEDDMYVSPSFYRFASQALDFYKDNDNIAGISTYCYNKNKFTRLPFIPMNNGFDCYFMQLPSSWGQAWTKKQWLSFKSFYSKSPGIDKEDKLPEQIKSWPETSWLKYFAKYMVENNLFFVYPYIAHTTNFADAGEHYLLSDCNQQVPLMNSATNKHYFFPLFNGKAIAYDVYFDIRPEYLKANGFFTNHNFIVDLCGSKQLTLFKDYDHILTTRKISHFNQSWDYLLLPIEENILKGIKGTTIQYGLLNDCSDIMSEDTLQKLACHGFSNTYFQAFEYGRKLVKQTSEFKIGYMIMHPTKSLLKGIQLFKQRYL